MKQKISLFIIFLFVFLIIPFFVFGQETPGKTKELIIFYSLNCHRCAEIKNEIIPDIEKKYKDKILIEYRDIADIKNYKLMLSLQDKYGAKGIKNILPVFYFEGSFLNGEGRIKEDLEALIAKSLNKQVGYEPQVSAIDLIAHFKTFRPFTIISAGLIDGINPCAFTVIVFFISFLTLQGYRKKELVIIGSSFIFSVFLTYILIGLGILGFLYSLKGFWRLAKIFNVSIGIFSIILGILALYDFFKFKKSGKTEGLILQLPGAVKNRIHSIIGLHYRKSKELKEKQDIKIPIFKLVLSAIITGFLVSILEAVCTGQVYLPTITFVLKTSSLKLQALGYLLLYNLMFIFPLLIIFLFALLGVTSEQFSQILKRHLLVIKILMAGLFLGLGIFLLCGCYSHNQKNLIEKPKIEDPFSWDFGRVEEGEILKHDFILKNESKNTLNIKNINTSCGCTVSSVKKKTLLPQESTLIEVTFNTKGYSGPTQQYIYVNTDNLDNPILRFIIKANVVK